MTPGRFRARAAALAMAATTATAMLGVSLAASGTGPRAVAADAVGCTSSQVAVVVNFSHWGNPARLGCVSWTSSLTGYDALGDAGFAVTGTTRYGPAFICRLDGYPSAGAPDHEDCINTPPATKYWSYWHANAGQTSWTYSTLGATSYHPHAGSVDAWTFGAGTQPPFTPSSVLPARPVTPTTSAARGTASAPTHPASSRPRPSATPTSSRSSPRAGAPSTTAGSRPTSNAGSGTATTGPSSASPSSSAPVATSGAVASAGASTSGPDSTKRAGAAGAGSAPSSGPSIVANDAAVARPNAAGGSAWPTVAAIAVVAVLAAAGGGYTWRRRRRADHGG